MPDRLRNPRRASTKSRRQVENSEFRGFVRRAIRALGARVASSDPDALVDLVSLRGEVDDAIGVAVLGLRDAGYSWTAIATPLGMTKQAAFKRWGSL